MKQFQLSLAVLLLSIISYVGVSLAYDVEYIGIDVDLNKDLTANVNITITPREPIKQFQWTLFYPIEDLTYSANFPISCDVKTTDISLITCNIEQNQSLRSFELSFKTKSYVKTVNSTLYSFFSDFVFPFKVSRLVTMIKLPEGYTFTDTSKIIPQPKRIGSDGKRIFAFWNYQDLEPDSALRVSFFFETPKAPSNSSSYLIIAVVVLTFIVLIAIFYLFYYRKRQFRIALSVIDEEERKVLEILDSENKPINQKKIVELTGFSKAKVSRIINSLHERKIVDVERRGRVNLVRLRSIYRGISKK